MLIVKSIDIRNNFKSWCEKVVNGETVVISRPRNENVYIIGEKEYNELKKAKEKAQAQQAQKKPAETKKSTKKYIQVATLNSEAAAKSAVSKLGGSFNYQKISGKGKTLYVIVSVSTDNPATLSSLENQVKTKLPSSKYIVRSAGK